MAIRQVPFEEATQSDLYAFATTSLGLDLRTNLGIPRLKAEIRDAGFVGDMLDITEADAPVDIAKRDASYVILMIQETEQKGAENPVPVNVNGRNILIPRGRWCEVRWPFYHALGNAVETRWYENDETKERYSREVPKYPFQLWQQPSPPPDLMRATTLAKAKAA